MLYKIKGFTLAEVLITLGIIGVIAAMTIPQLINGYQKSVVENKLKKFYSMINQALNSSLAEYGEYTLPDCFGMTVKSCSYDENLNWLNIHVLSYIKYERVEKCKITQRVSDGVCVYLYDGDSFGYYANGDGSDFVYCIHCDANLNITPENPRKKFWFNFYKSDRDNSKAFYSSKYSIDPYQHGWTGTISDLKNNNKYGCRKNNTRFEFCAKYIQMNNWKIPDDYPW